MALQVKALLAGIPQQAIGYVEEALGSVYGKSNYTLVTPSNDSEVNLAAADAKKDTRMALVVFSTDMDAYIQGKSGEGICSTGKYFKYTNDDAALVSWLNETLGSEVVVRAQPVYAVNNGAQQKVGLGYYPTEDLGLGIGAGESYGAGIKAGESYGAGIDAGAYSTLNMGASPVSGYSSASVYGDANVENIELKSQIKGLTEALNNIKRQYSLQQRVLGDTQTKLSEKDQEVASLKNQLQASEQAVNSSRAEQESLMRQVSDLTRQLTASNREMQGIRGSLIASQGYAKKLEAANTQLQSDSAVSKNSLQESQASLGRVKSERDDALTALAAADKREKNLLAEKKKLEARVAQADKSLTILNQNRINSANENTVIDKANWAFLASKSAAQDAVLIPRYYGDIARR